MSSFIDNSQHMLESFEDFTRKAGGFSLRSYQLAPARAILESIRLGLGLDFVVIMPRQSGKDELLAHLKAYLMRVMCRRERGIVEVNPTYKPQTINAIMRLENRLDANLLTKGRWKKRSDFFRMIGLCRTAFYSGDGQAQVVGATADLCLIINEAQDIAPSVYAKQFSPMAASRAATRIICGTVWTSGTLLSQMLRQCREAEKTDGLRRVFLYTAEDVRKENPKYGKFVDGEVLRMGRQHPFIKTQYFCEEIDAQAGMFPPGRQALMHGSHPARLEPEPGKLYCFLIDVAGQDECAGRLQVDTAPAEHMSHRQNTLSSAEFALGRAAEGSRDSTALKIVEIDLGSLSSLGKPTYRVVHRRLWTGAKHVTVFGALRALAAAWQPRYIVIDATGVGEGLWSLLENAFGGNVVRPVKFTPALKSELGYGFISIVESGRYQEYHPFDQTFQLQLDQAISEIVPGPAKLMRWSVPDGTRGPGGEPVHDDDLLASSLCVLLDRLEWYTPTPPMIVPGRDPLEGMDRRF